MQIAMISIDRSPQPNYIFDTLASLRASAWNPTEIPLTLCLGNEQSEYVGKLGCRVHPWDGPPFENRFVALVDNYVRALRLGGGGVVLCEDDLEFTPRWVERLRRAVTEIEKRRSRYLLALYAPHNPGWRWFERNAHFRPYSPRYFYGTQAMYYPESVRSELADYLEAHRRRLPADLLIREWCCDPRRKRMLYMLPGSVVQHVGTVSTGVAGCDHRAWNLLAA